MEAKSSKIKTKAASKVTSKASAERRAIKSESDSPDTFTAAGRELAADAVDVQLARYRSMRDFAVTDEPSGDAKDGTEGALPFCIQKHAASHLHYDFRLGWRGVLKSWACAKGPSYNVKDKRLAVQVEDHPMEYGGFEGIIPAGQYGGGTVMLWDQGTWEPQPGHTDVDAGLRDGSLKITMRGTKMHGKWALIRMGGKAATGRKPNWLLIKEHDDFERSPEAEAVTDLEANSVVTGRSLEEITANEDHVWNSKETARGSAWFRKEASEPEKEAPAAAPPSKTSAGFLKALSALPKELQPSFLKPQLAQETTVPPEGSAWIHELKLDGYRMQARKSGAEVQMLTRSGLDWTDKVRTVAAEVARLPVDTVTIDGEVVVLAANGTTNFADLQASFQEGTRNPLTYFCFDLLHVNGHSPRERPLLERKQLLAEILANADRSTLQLSEHLTTNGEEMFHKACELHAEGIVSKKAGGRYSGGRSLDWLKSKCLHEQEFVVGGYTYPGKGGPGIGALLLGFYNDSGTLLYAGRTGTGFTQKASRTLRQQLEALEQTEVTFQRPPAGARRGARWVKPQLVAQVRFATWTADDQLRQAAFLGLREDKLASEVRRERADVAPRPKSAKYAVSPVKRVATQKSAQQAATKHPQFLPVEKAPVRLTHPDKILDPASGLTKQQLAHFYWSVSERMLPHIAGRALSIVRLPEGIGKPSFYQKHVTSMLPPGFEAVDVPDKKTGVVEKYIALSTREAIASFAQISVLEVHPWGSKGDDLEHADRLVIDLDPDEALSWQTLTRAADDVRQALATLGLQSFLKTTGGKGLHVVIPIQPDLEWSQIKEFCHGFVSLIERSNPKLYLTKMTKAARVGKIYLDYLRNERGATAVAPYSPRARAHVGVAVPLEWPELDLTERPDFRIGNFPDWGARLNHDPWSKMLTLKQRITKEAQRKVGMST